MLLENSGKIIPERMKRWSQSKKQHPVVKVTVDGVLMAKTLKWFAIPFSRASYSIK